MFVLLPLLHLLALNALHPAFASLLTSITKLSTCYLRMTAFSRPYANCAQCPSQRRHQAVSAYKLLWQAIRTRAVLPAVMQVRSAAVWL